MRILAAAWGIFWVGVALAQATETTNRTDAQVFQFKFDPNKPLVYAAELKKADNSDTDVGLRDSTKRSTVETRYRMRLTATGTNQDGTLAVYFEPFDYDEDTHSLGSGGQVDSTIHNLSIVSKQNGITMVDTDKGIGLGEAENLKLAVYPRLLSGFMDFYPTGTIKGYEGDLPFIDSWQQQLKLTSNMFDIVFPARPIAVGESWTNYYTLRKAGSVSL